MNNDPTNRAARPVPNDMQIKRVWNLDDRTKAHKLKPPLLVDVITAGRDPDAPPEQTHRINYNRLASRDWLNDHIAWALNTGRTVHLAKVDRIG